MDTNRLEQRLDALGDVVRLGPQIVARFYPDGNRLGQRRPGARRPPWFKPERWIGSSTAAANPPGLPAGGLSACPQLGPRGRVPALRDLLADERLGPRLLGERRFREHAGTFRVLVKLLDAQQPIPFHVHAADRFVQAHPQVYPRERFGKDEAYYFLEAPKGVCPYTHVGVHAGVGPRELLAAVPRGSDALMELSPVAPQVAGEGLFVHAGLLHRPGSALTLEIQQPSDVYTIFQRDLAGQPLPPEVIHPGFAALEAAAEAVVDWDANRRPGLIEAARLRPAPREGAAPGGGRIEWVFLPSVTANFSGVRLTVESAMRAAFDEPFVLFVWRGRGMLEGAPIAGGGGPVGKADEFFIGQGAASRGVELVNAGVEPLVAFALFAASV